MAETTFLIHLQTKIHAFTCSLETWKTRMMGIIKISNKRIRMLANRQRNKEYLSKKFKPTFLLKKMNSENNNNEHIHILKFIYIYLIKPYPHKSKSNNQVDPLVTERPMFTRSRLIWFAAPVTGGRRNLTWFGNLPAKLASLRRTQETRKNETTWKYFSVSLYLVQQSALYIVYCK